VLASQPVVERFFDIERLLAGITVACHVLIVVSLFWIGYGHFGKAVLGASAALLYLLLPYSAYHATDLLHLVPATLLVLMLAVYRLPLLAGLLLGLGCAVAYFPAFLVPLWMSYYYRRGLGRLLLGMGIALAALAISLWQAANLMAGMAACPELARLASLGCLSPTHRRRTLVGPGIALCLSRTDFRCLSGAGGVQRLLAATKKLRPFAGVDDGVDHRRAILVRTGRRHAGAVVRTAHDSGRAPSQLPRTGRPYRARLARTPAGMVAAFVGRRSSAAASLTSSAPVSGESL
jgi:hypothetical protein